MKKDNKKIELSHKQKQDVENNQSNDQVAEIIPFDSRDAQLLELDKELEAKAKEAKENFDKYLRALAEFDNYKKRTQKEKEEVAQYIQEGLLRDLIPMMDNFERALDASKNSRDYDGFVSGVELILQQFKKFLEKNGITAFNSLGESFDPTRHEAVMRVESDEYDDHTVVEELLKGYTINGKILRPAMVKVATRVTKEEPSENQS